MDIRKRLHISNVVMIVAPVAIACVVGIVCVALVWTLVTGGAPLSSEAVESFLGIEDVSEHVESSFKFMAVVVAGALVVAVVAAIVVTDRFVTRFMLAHITEPLARLSKGVEQIREGNLDYRIGYEGDDEFAPVCSAFDEMARRLEESVERDRRGEQARKELIAGMSHDLRSPLTSIRGYAEGLRDGVASDDETRQRYVGVILEKTSEIERKVSQLLTMNKLDMEEYAPDMEPVPLGSYVRGFFERSRDDLAAQGMDVTLDLENPIVSASLTELDRIMGNILDNSLRYRKSARVAVTVSVRDEDDHAVLELSDDGPGVSDADLTRIFDALYRSDAARSNNREGTGLGLSIVAASVARMGGAVHAERSDAGGLAIVIELPYSSEQADAPETQRESETS
jgi:signal transduction histidine kinase